MIVAGLIFFRQKSPPEHRLHPQQFEDLRRGYYPKQRLRMITALDSDHPGSRGGHLFENTVFEEMATARTWVISIKGGDHPESLFGVITSSQIFQLLRVQPMLE